MDEKLLEERLAKLEAIISFQDQVIDDLNQVVVEHTRALDELSGNLEKLKKAVTEPQESNDNSKPPPHY